MCSHGVLCYAPLYSLLQEVADMWRLAEEAVHCNDGINASVASYMNITNAIQRLPPVSGWVGTTTVLLGLVA